MADDADEVRRGPGGPKLNRVVIRLTDPELEAVDSFAASRGLSRSRAIARCVNDLLLPE